jgi:hypothetical protein
LIPGLFNPRLSERELFGALLKSRLNQDPKLFEVFNGAGLGDSFLDLLTNSSDGIQVRRVRGQVHQYNL